MRVTALGSVAGSSALFLCLLGSAAPAQDMPRRAPLIRVFSQDGGGVVSNYVTPAIEVAEDAYVFAVMMDLDGRIQVLQPEFPGISIRLRSNQQLRLPNFFAGYNSSFDGRGRYASGNGNYGDSWNDTRGTVVAIASRAPFNLESIEVDGDWNMTEIRRLIEFRSPVYAANALAQRLGAKGEPIGHDYMRFAGQQRSYYAYDDLAYCGYGYGYGSMGAYFSIARALRRDAGLRSATLRQVVVGYDACGLPVFALAPIAPGGGVRVPPPPRSPGDTTIFPKSRIPAGIPRYPRSADAAPNPGPVPVGSFPVPARSGSAPRELIPAPERRRVEPREVSDVYRTPLGSSTAPARPAPPTERAAPPQRERAPTAVMPIYRPEPRVIERAPVRTPERIREAPPPVVQQRPAAPPPPPPPPPGKQ